MFRKFILAGVVLGVMSWVNTSHAQESDYVNPCTQAPHTDFNFWVNDWAAFDYNTGVLLGMDNVTRTNGGCVVIQEWRQMTDNFRAEGSPVRYAGMSFNSVLNDGRWQQVWVGDYGGTIIVTGGLNDEGHMVLRSGEQTTADGTVFERIWYWVPEDDGTVHSWGDVVIQNEDGSWSDPQTQWNLRYVSRHNVRNLVEADAAE